MGRCSLQRGSRSSADRATVRAVSKLVRITLWVVAGLMVLQSVGVSISGLLAFGGIGGIAVGFAAKDLLANTAVSNFFDSMAVRLDGEAARGEDLTVEFYFTDLDERHRLRVHNSVLNHRQVDAPGEADASLSLTRPMFDRLILGDVGIKDALFSDDLALEGSKLSLLSFFGLFEDPDPTFPIVTP